MPKSLRGRRHRALIAVLVASRRDAGLTQRDLAKKLKRTQTWVANTETGERRLDVAEFFEVAAALGVDPVVLFTRVAQW